MIAAATDQGLQPQRTALAWSRTSFAIFVNALLTIRAAAEVGSPLLYVMASLLAVACVALVAMGRWRQRFVLRNGVLSSPPALLMLLVAMCAGLAFAAAVIGLGQRSN